MDDYLLDCLRARCRMYERNLVTLDDVCGYMQALLDAGIIGRKDVEFILGCLMSEDSDMREWLYD